MAQCLSTAEAVVFVLMVGDSDQKINIPEDKNNNVISELTLIFFSNNAFDKDADDAVLVDSVTGETRVEDRGWCERTKGRSCTG